MCSVDLTPSQPKTFHNFLSQHKSPNPHPRGTRALLTRTYSSAAPNFSNSSNAQLHLLGPLILCFIWPGQAIEHPAPTLPMGSGILLRKAGACLVILPPDIYPYLLFTRALLSPSLSQQMHTPSLVHDSDVSLCRIGYRVVFLFVGHSLPMPAVDVHSILYIKTGRDGLKYSTPAEPLGNQFRQSPHPRPIFVPCSVRSSRSRVANQLVIDVAVARLSVFSSGCGRILPFLQFRICIVARHYDANPSVKLSLCLPSSENCFADLKTL